MQSPFIVQNVFNADLGKVVWELKRKDGAPLDDDGAVAYNFDSAENAIPALQKMSSEYYRSAKT